jgi:cytochrome c oxidase assembly factor CtaG
MTPLAVQLPTHLVGGAGAGSRLVVLLPLLALTLAFLLGTARLAVGRASVWRGAARLGRWRVIAFLAALAVVAVAVAGPVDEVADRYFWAHMGQHMMLIVVAAPLLAVSAPGTPLLLVLPVRQRARLARLRLGLRTRTSTGWLFLPVTAWLLHVATLWGWHLPAAYDAATASPALHATEHLMFLVTAWAFWWHVLAGREPVAVSSGPPRVGRSLSGPMAVLYVFATMLPMSALGAVLTFARSPLYPGQVHLALESGINPLTDQQLAGLVMWIPADVVYLLVVVALFLPWLTSLAGDDDEELVGAPVPAGGGR